MSGGGTSTNTVQQTIPSWLQPYYTGAFNRGQNLLGQGGPQQSAGQTAPMTSLENQGIGSIAQAATQNPAESAGNWNQYVTSGGLMNPSSNPYLAGEFSNAANSVQNQLASEFGAAGRNVIGSAPVQADAMNNLASQLYGGQYATNVAATNQAAVASPTIEQGMYIPGQELYNAGSAQQQQAQNILNQQTAQYNYNQALPYNSLSWYSSLLDQNAQPFRSSTSVAQMPNNSGLGAAGGALAGAQAGSMFGPWGTGIGALAGGLLGGFG